MGTFMNAGDYGQGGWKVVVVAALLVIMQTLMVIGRVISRKIQKVALAADDYVLLSATVLSTALCAIALGFPRIAGVGPHISSFQMKTASEGMIVGQTSVAWTVIYGASIALSKCAILLLYVRVFTTSKKAFTATAILIGFIVIATSIANTFVSIFQCSPISFAWNKSTQDGSCIDEVAWPRYMAIPNVLTGAIMLIMPLPIIWKLNVTLSAKVALTATFLHGIIGFIASCARLSILFSTPTATFSNNISLTWTIWTLNEPANYIIAACLPTLRPIFVRILPTSFFPLTRKPSKSKPYSSSLKVSWPRGSLVPKFSLGSKSFQTNSQITGPWSRTEVRQWEADGGVGYWTDIEGGRDERVLVATVGEDRTKDSKKGMGVGVRTEEVGVREDF